ncbi:MAG: type pantothenate kinase [Herminiimonas sp.]|nr:type pantothenate kinase [Herminiimonas sp.]
MLLLIDAGNTRVKWALAEECGPGAGAADAGWGRWAAAGAAGHAELAHLATAWRAAKPSRILISNVAGAAVREALDRLLEGAAGAGASQAEWFKSAPQRGSVRNAYRDPAQLGCDRFASAIGARAQFPGQPLLIVTCGTATTIDALTADGVFLGGMILPGLDLMAAALASNTAQLPQVAQQTAAITPFADNTADAIASGCIAAQTGAIEHALGALNKRHGAARCILSGGAAGRVAPHLQVPCSMVENLVLIGLQVVAMEQDPSC